MSTYSYDGDGLRASKTVGGATTSFAWDVSGGLPLAVRDGSTSVVYGLGGLPLEQVAADGAAQWFFHDQLGSTRALTDSSGAVVGTWSYDPYGAVVASSGSASTRFGFAGEYADGETGFVYLRARYYDPATGQFLSRDPLVGLTRSAYGYVSGNPLNGADPTGLACLIHNNHGGCLGGSVARTAGAFVGGMLSHDCSRERNERDMLACSFGFALPYAMVLGGEASAAGNAATGGGSDSECVASEEEAAAEASTPVGQRGSPMTVQRGTNSPAEIGGRQYGGHALDEMQSEGFTPTVVEDAIAQGQSSVGASGRIAYYSQANNITVIVEDGRVVTVTSGTVKVR